MEVMHYLVVQGKRGIWIPYFAITVLNAVGGSTNGILHLLALAHEAKIKLDYDDFERIRKKTPHIADMKPGGNYVMNSLDKIGGIPVVVT